MINFWLKIMILEHSIGFSTLHTGLFQVLLVANLYKFYVFPLMFMLSSVFILHQNCIYCKHSVKYCKLVMFKQEEINS